MRAQLLNVIGKLQTSGKTSKELEMNQQQLLPFYCQSFLSILYLNNQQVAPLLWLLYLVPSQYASPVYHHFNPLHDSAQKTFKDEILMKNKFIRVLLDQMFIYS